jgi:hypothetical protein
MHGSLYLDTARYGRMEPAAQLASRDFARLIGDEGASPRVESLVADGIDSLPPRLRGCFAGLEGWRGISGLKDALRGVLHADPPCEVLLAQRSALLMRLAARSLFRRCRRVLYTDLEWPGYLSVLDAERGRARGEAVPIPVRDLVFRDGISALELVRFLANHFRERACDGLFLSAVSHEGVKLPVAELVELLSITRSSRFVVIDGSQAIGHAPKPLPPCDIFLGGTHKWLGSGHPLGVAFVPRQSSLSFVVGMVEEMIASDDLDDPLLKFCRHLEKGFLEHSAETVGLAPLFTSMASADRHLDTEDSENEAFEGRIRNGDELCAAAAEAHWLPLRTDRALRTGILLLEPRNAAAGRRQPALLRNAFQSRGITLSAYPGGCVRLSLPADAWERGSLGRLRTTLRQLS